MTNEAPTTPRPSPQKVAEDVFQDCQHSENAICEWCVAAAIEARDRSWEEELATLNSALTNSQADRGVQETIIANQRSKLAGAVPQEELCGLIEKWRGQYPSPALRRCADELESLIEKRRGE